MDQTAQTSASSTSISFENHKKPHREIEKRNKTFWYCAGPDQYARDCWDRKDETNIFRGGRGRGSFRGIFARVRGRGQLRGSFYRGSGRYSYLVGYPGDNHFTTEKNHGFVPPISGGYLRNDDPKPPPHHGARTNS